MIALLRSALRGSAQAVSAARHRGEQHASSATRRAAHGAQGCRSAAEPLALRASRCSRGAPCVTSGGDSSFSPRTSDFDCDDDALKTAPLAFEEKTQAQQTSASVAATASAAGQSAPGHASVCKGSSSGDSEFIPDGASLRREFEATFRAHAFADRVEPMTRAVRRRCQGRRTAARRAAPSTASSPCAASDSSGACAAAVVFLELGTELITSRPPRSLRPPQRPRSSRDLPARLFRAFLGTRTVARTLALTTPSLSLATRHSAGSSRLRFALPPIESSRRRRAQSDEDTKDGVQ